MSMTRDDRRLAADRRRAGSPGSLQRQVMPRIVLILVCALFLLPFYWMVITALKTHAGSARLSAPALADRVGLVQFPRRRRVLPVLAVPAQHLDHHGADHHRRRHLQPDHRLRLLPHRVAGPRPDLLPRAGDRLHPLPGAHRRPLRHLRQDCRARFSTAGNSPGRGTGSTPICRWSCRCSSATPSGSS